MSSLTFPFFKVLNAHFNKLHFNKHSHFNELHGQWFSVNFHLMGHSKHIIMMH